MQITLENHNLHYINLLDQKTNKFHWISKILKRIKFMEKLMFNLKRFKVNQIHLFLLLWHLLNLRMEISFMLFLKIYLLIIL